MGHALPERVSLQALVAKVKARVGTPVLNTANLATVRHRLIQESEGMIKELAVYNHSVREIDLYHLIRDALPLVFVPDEREIILNSLLNDSIYRSNLWSLYRTICQMFGKWVPRSLPERIDLYLRPEA